jgi:hypothetical protein
LLVEEAEQDPQLAERLRRVLGAASHGPAPSLTPAAMRFADFAAHVGVSRWQIFSLARQGLPTIGTGKGRRVDVARALEWMRTQGERVDAPAPASGVDASLAAVAADAAARASRRRRRGAP